MKHLQNIYVLILPLLLISCSEDGDITPDLLPDEGVSELVVSGAESGTITNNGAEFLQTISSVSGGELSSIVVYMGNIGTTETALRITVGDLGNGAGLDEKTYSYSPDPEANPILNSVYVTGTDSYLHNPDANDPATVTYTKITDDVVEGNFDINLESVDGNKINIKGSFKANGDTFRN